MVGFLERAPQLRAEWGDNERDPETLSHGSTFKANWVCGRGHNWQAQVKARVKGAGCPYCSNRLLLPGFNDLATTHPELAAEWHPTKNSKEARGVQPGSPAKAWWIGACGHEFEQEIRNRAVRGKGCPVCSGQRVSPGFNDLATTHPELAAEWHPTKNTHPATGVTRGSTKKAWWLGRCGHEWQALIANRSLNRAGCPFCSSNTLLPGFNDLATLRPDLAAEWSPRNTLRPSEVAEKSGKRVWWVCPKGHEWRVAVGNRAHLRSGCPVCSGQRVSPGVNDLATLRPDLVAEWHPSNDPSPGDVKAGSSFRAKWACVKGHTWEAKVADRALRGNDCKRCAMAGTSRAEQELAEFVRSLGVSITTHNRKIAPGYEFDIAAPEKKIAIEYNGLYWHSEKHKPRNYHRDKMQAAQEAGWSVVHVWEDDPMPVIRSMLARKLGVSTEPRYNARSLQKGDVGRVEAREFLNANHVQGYSPGSVRLGLWEDNTLVALMLFRSRGEGVWELSRYATAGVARGGFTRLLTTFVKEHQPTQVVSFSDNAVSDGGVYEQAGFTRDGEIAPDYTYLVGGRRVHKFNYRLNRFRTDPDLKFEPGLTEKELADLNGLPRIYDAGKVRWVLNTLC